MTRFLQKPFVRRSQVFRLATCMKINLKENAPQIGIILLGFAVIAGTLSFLPRMLELLYNVSYKFVLIFLVIVVVSNILAKLTCRYLTM